MPTTRYDLILRNKAIPGVQGVRGKTVDCFLGAIHNNKEGNKEVTLQDLLRSLTLEGLDRETVFCVDIDGTLIPFDANSEDLMTRRIPKCPSYYKATRLLIEAVVEYVSTKNILFVSHYNKGNLYELADKQALVKNLGFDAKNFIPVPFGQSKALAIMDKFQMESLQNFVLLDDFHKNLVDWSKKGGCAFRVYNGRNERKSINWGGLTFVSDVLSINSVAA